MFLLLRRPLPIFKIHILLKVVYTYNLQRYISNKMIDLLYIKHFIKISLNEYMKCIHTYIYEIVYSFRTTHLFCTAWLFGHQFTSSIIFFRLTFYYPSSHSIKPLDRESNSRLQQRLAEFSLLDHCIQLITVQ